MIAGETNVNIDMSRSLTMSNLRHRLLERFFRIAATGYIPRRLFGSNFPVQAEMPKRRGRLKLEIVSHCWRYAKFLTYQLSSLALHAPQNIDVQMTVFHSPCDAETASVLQFFSGQTVPGVTWNWQPIDKHSLFRRAIGRNLAALQTDADWVWFTDCDQIFHAECLDHLADILQGRGDLLVYPTQVGLTDLLEDDDQLLQDASQGPRLLDIEPQSFTTTTHTRAVGALQIVHGDAARSIGYCRDIRFLQEPVDRWRKTYEDRVFRWLLGSQGTPIDLNGLFRIEHLRKGRYTDRGNMPLLRRWSRELQLRFLTQRSDSPSD